MSKNKIEVLERDDEILREQGMIGGPVKTGRWKLRPSTAREVSWMGTGKIIKNRRMDEWWRLSAFIYIHSAPIDEINSVIYSTKLFVAAVYDWMAKEKPTKGELESAFPTYQQRVNEWYSATSELKESGPSSGN